MEFARIRNDALQLPEEERIDLVESIMVSLSEVREETTHRELEIAQERLTNYRKGEKKSVSAEEAFRRFENR